MMGCCVICSKLFLNRINLENDEEEPSQSEFCRRCDGNIQKIQDLVEEYNKIYDSMFWLGLTISNINLKTYMRDISKSSKLDWQTPEEYHFDSIKRFHTILFRDFSPETLGRTSVLSSCHIQEVQAFPHQIRHFFRNADIPPDGDNIGNPLRSNFMDSIDSGSLYGITCKSKSSPGIRHSASAKIKSPKVKTKLIRRDKLFGCPTCQKKFRQKRSLDLHFRNHQDNNVTNKCHVCEKTFDTPILLTMHLSLHQGSFTCSEVFCKKSFQSFELLEKHSTVHDSNTKFDCNFCFQMFDNSDELKIHESNHFQTQNSFLCEYCGESFPSNPVLADHRKRVHDDKLLKFSCPMCEKMFQRKSTLIIHERTHSTHYDEKPFKCDRCTFSSAQSSALKLHQRKHTGVMPHKCNHCTNHPGYSYKKALLQHLAQIHPDEYLIRKSFLCQVCWKNFETEQELDNHNVQHNKYKCKLCDRQFKMMVHLKEHLLRHADIKQFKCQFCEMDFMRRKALIVHIQNSHPDEDPEPALISNSISVEFDVDPIDA